MIKYILVSTIILNGTPIQTSLNLDDKLSCEKAALNLDKVYQEIKTGRWNITCLPSKINESQNELNFKN